MARRHTSLTRTITASATTRQLSRRNRSNAKETTLRRAVAAPRPSDPKVSEDAVRRQRTSSHHEAALFAWINLVMGTDGLAALKASDAGLAIGQSMRCLRALRCSSVSALAPRDHRYSVTRKSSASTGCGFRRRRAGVPIEGGQHSDDRGQALPSTGSRVTGLDWRQALTVWRRFCLGVLLLYLLIVWLGACLASATFSRSCASAMRRSSTFCDSAP
jgi:hypothetical protein